MSGKAEKQDSPTSKVLQKARSFKHDLKSRIRRTPSGSRADKEPSPARKSRHHRKRVGRTGSFNEASKTDSDGKAVSDAEKLDQDGIKVYSAIKYLRDVVNKGVQEQLSGATNIVLESVYELHQSISKYFLNQESTLLASTYNQVYEALAKLILWADHKTLEHPQTLDKKCVQEFIDPLENGVKELLKLSKEKLIAADSSPATMVTNMSKTLQRPPSHRKTTSDSRSPPVPEPMPLSPEELRILREGSALLSNSPTPGMCPPTQDNVDAKPPPKPPLPPDYVLRGSLKQSLGVDDEDEVFDVMTTDTQPPPLPLKSKSRTHSSYDNTDTLPDDNHDDGQSRAHATPGPHSPPRDAMVTPPQDAMVTPPRTQSPASSVSSAMSEDYLLEDACTGRSRSGSAGPASPQKLQSTSMVTQRLSHYDNHCHMTWGTPSDPSTPCDSTPTGTPTPTPTPTQTFFTRPPRQGAQEQISQITKQISHFVHSSSSYRDDTGIYDNKDCVTSASVYDNKSSLSMSVTNELLPPPLPDKQNKKPSPDGAVMRNRVPSIYDNMSAESQPTTAHNSSVSMTTSTAFSVAAAKSQSMTEVSGGGAPSHRYIQSSSASKAAVSSRNLNTRRVVVGGRQYTTESTTVSSGVQMRYMKEKTVVPDNEEECVDSVDWDPADGNPPPLPLKKRHVEEYMHLFGQSSTPSVNELTRRSVHSTHFYQEQWQQHQMEVFMPMYPRSNTFSMYSVREGSRDGLLREGVLRDGTRVSDLLSLMSQTSIDTQRTSGASDVMSVVSGSSSEDGQSNAGSALIQPTASPLEYPKGVLPPERTAETVNTQRTSNTSSSSGVSSRQSDPTMTSSTHSETTEDDDLGARKDTGQQAHSKNNDNEKRSSAPAASTPTIAPTMDSPIKQTNGKKSVTKDTDSAFSEAELNILDEVEVSHYLVRKKKDEDGPDLRGGLMDALLVHATTTGKHDFMYQEAFLTTYRSMMTSHELIQKLIYRYNRFSRMNDISKKKLSRNAFSLLTRVVNELCTEVDETLIQTLMDLVFQMLCDGDLSLAKVLRHKVLEKCTYLRKLRESTQQELWPQYKVSTRQYNLFNFKSQDIAEQLTLMDAELFQKIEIPEVLLWAKEQNEEHSPNLTKFTEHFNKMSYWCRTRILEQEDPRDREHCFVKFIKIMRFLEKFNNFNSYLAILSALSSSPLARLDWQKQNSEMLSQYFQLIDNTHGFRTYRQRLAETEPPCIPYIGLVLQDLTFVHVGNKDWLSEGVINFVKRWQQFNILDNMRRFKKCDYDFTRKEKIMSFFSSFDNYLPEETLWQISESIKTPRRTVYK